MTYPIFFMGTPNRLRELRKLNGLTQAQLAERSGVSQSAISQIESGKLSMDMQWMRSFARILGCAAADLFPAEDAPDRLDDHERLLIERYRMGDDDQRETLERVAQAVVPIAANDERKRASA